MRTFWRKVNSARVMRASSVAAARPTASPLIVDPRRDQHAEPDRCRRSSGIDDRAARSRRRSTTGDGAAARRRRRSGPCPATSRCRTRTPACRCRRRSRRGRGRRRTRTTTMPRASRTQDGSMRQPDGRERADDDAEEDEVHERVGEADGDLQALARRGGAGHGVVEQQGADRRDAERGREAVHPHDRRHARRAGAHQGERADQRQRREQQVAGVGQRRDRGSPPPSTGPPCSRSRPASRPRCRRRSSARPGARPGRRRRSRPTRRAPAAMASTTSWPKRENSSGPGRAPRGDDGDLPDDQPDGEASTQRARRRAVKRSSEAHRREDRRRAPAL